MKTRIYAAPAVKGLIYDKNPFIVGIDFNFRIWRLWRRQILSKDDPLTKA